MDLQNNRGIKGEPIAPPRVAFYTLGCKVNYYETEALRELFRQEGFAPVGIYDYADVYVINTCTVTHLADRKARQLIRRAKRQNPQSLVAVCGCYPQADPAAVAAIPGADLIAGTAQRRSLPAMIKKRLRGENFEINIKSYGRHAQFEQMPWTPEQGRTRAFLKIQDGCDRYCSYCIIPIARGPLRSLPFHRALESLAEIGEAGYGEVVLTGIHLGLYGVDLNPPASLAALLEEAVRLPGLERIRLGSLEPADFNDDLISIIAAHAKICRHLHIPLQSGDDFILQRMNRQYDTAFFRRLLDILRSNISDLATTTDIIVGFPGEGEEHFQNSLAFVEECAFSRLHVFPYSTRRGTRAAEMGPAVPPGIKKERSRKMIALGARLSLEFQKKFLGRTVPVLFEKIAEEKTEEKIGGPQHLLLLEGLTSQYLRVRALASSDLRGQLRNVLLHSHDGTGLYGSIVP